MELASSINSRLIRIYDADIVPFRLLRTKVGTDYFTQQFQFKETGAEGIELVFMAGSHAFTEAVVVPINMVSVNDRRIILDVEGSAATADAVLTEVQACLSPMVIPEPKQLGDHALITAHETQCAVKMEFGWSDLLADAFADFLVGQASEEFGARAGADASARVLTMNLRFHIAFATQDASLADHGIELSDKVLIIEPRKNTPLSERIFFTASPLDATAHLDLLRALEQRIVSKGKRRKVLPPTS
jgi:hypothetical protein